MSQISIYDHPPRVVVQLEGRFIDSDVELVARAWDQIKKWNRDPIFMDLSYVRFISTTGLCLLRRMYDDGVKLIISGPLKHYTLEEIRIIEPKITVFTASDPLDQHSDSDVINNMDVPDECTGDEAA